MKKHKDEKSTYSKYNKDILTISSNDSLTSTSMIQNSKILLSFLAFMNS